jgi:uncharacterized membrane protein
MKYNKSFLAFVMLLVILLNPILCFVVVAQEDYTFVQTTMRVYRDGLAHITQTLTVNELLPKVDIPLLSASVENLIVLDNNQLTIDFTLNITTLTVFTLGANEISVEYDTLALTNKQAEVWTIQLDNPYELKLILPLNSTIVYLNKVPTLIDSTSNELSLSIGSNQWEISYIVPLQEDNQDNSTSVTFPIGYLVAGIVILAILVIILTWVLRRKRKINIKKTINENPTLNKDDKAVIEFLAEKDGKAFEAEIRQRFPELPRTSLWRLVRRLEGLEIVEIKRIGLENQVILIKK